jgi:hypothetical protein
MNLICNYDLICRISHLNKKISLLGEWKLIKMRKGIFHIQRNEENYLLKSSNKFSIFHVISMDTKTQYMVDSITIDEFDVECIYITEYVLNVNKRRWYKCLYKDKDDELQLQKENKLKQSELNKKIKEDRLKIKEQKQEEEHKRKMDYLEEAQQLEIKKYDLQVAQLRLHINQLSSSSSSSSS